jgi:hypothetical protein
LPPTVSEILIMYNERHTNTSMTMPKNAARP